MAARAAHSSSEPLTYGSLADVQVPIGTGLGEPFVIQHRRMKSGQPVLSRRTLWRASGNAPVVMPAKVELATGRRHEHRPQASARAAGGSTAARTVEFARATPHGLDITASAIELPCELCEADVGWLPGPVGGKDGRPLPTFTGRPMGARDQTLSGSSSARAVMRSVQFTRRYKERIIHHAVAHRKVWQEQHEKKDGTERALSTERMRPELVELWFAAAARVAMLNPHLPANLLWDPSSRHFDEQLAEALPYDMWRCLNRHLSFGGTTVRDDQDDCDGASSSESDAEDAGTEATEAPDRFRKRREVSDLARQRAGQAFHPGQHLGFDDCIRVTRHWEGARQRHKAAVHTGRPCDSLNCAHSNYFIHWEEQGWCRDATPGRTGTGNRDNGNSSGDVGAGKGDGNGEANGGSAEAARVGVRAAASGRGRGGRGRGRSRSQRGRGRDSQSSATEPTSSVLRAADRDPGAGSSANAQDDSSDDSSHDSDVISVNSMLARVKRATTAVRRDVGHCIWMDRGMANLSALQWLHGEGFPVTGIMQANRIGLPRRYLEAMKKQLICPKSCTHDSRSAGCKRWQWTVLHKGDWELQVWGDGGSLVIALTTATSATRSAALCRTVANKMYLAQCPEGIALYNLFGRGPTDGGDSLRKRLSLAVRRRERQGPKGALFDAELGFVNGKAIAELLRHETLTMWQFVEEYCSDVLSTVSTRQCIPMAISQSATRAQRQSHQLVNFAEEARKARRNNHTGTGTARRGTCCMRDSECEPCDDSEPVRTSLYCPGCARRKGCSGWYHWACYWRCHSAMYCK